MKRLAILLLAVACHEPVVRTFAVGEHHIEVVVPDGWQALDQGRQVAFRQDEDNLTFLDLGPVRPEGFRTEAARAQELWRSGRTAEARTRLRELPSRGELSAAYSDPPDFDALFAAIDALPPAPLDEIVDDALPLLGHDPRRREVKWRRRIRVDGREGMALETWLTLTHEDPRRLLVIVNAGRALAVRCDRCQGPASDAFDRVAEGLHFAAGSRK